MWEIKYEYNYLYAYYPAVVICPKTRTLFVRDRQLKVEQLVDPRDASDPSASHSGRGWQIVEETSLSGTISGTITQGHIFKTMSGSIYEVSGVTLQLVLEVQPSVTVLRRGGEFKLVVEGFDEPLTCKCLTCNENGTNGNSALALPIESRIVSDFDGLNHGNIYKLANGQLWEQTEYWIWIWIAVNPRVLIWEDGGRYLMKVQDIDHAVGVEKVN